jgi:predicted nuclease of restriction endonuclease-like RecB superfamily
MKVMHQDYSGEKNPFYGKKHTHEAREKMSASHSQRIAKFGTVREKQNGRGHKGWYSSYKMKTDFYFDSALEKFRMTQLDSDKNVLSWTKKHEIIIQYEFKGCQRNYIPDFLIEEVDGSVIVEEVKGYDIKSRKKKKALIEFCKVHKYKYRWLTQNSNCFKRYREFLKKEREIINE